MAPSCLFVCLGLAVVFAAGVQSEDASCTTLKDEVTKNCKMEIHDLTISCNMAPSVGSNCIQARMKDNPCKENSTLEFMKIKRAVYDLFCVPTHKKVLSADKQCQNAAIQTTGILFGMISTSPNGMIDCEKIKMDWNAELKMKKYEDSCVNILEQITEEVAGSSLCQVGPNSAHATVASTAMLLATAMVWWSSTTIF